MKTTISVPDDVFEAADAMARRLGISRSELYARAVRAFLDVLRQEDVTARLDAVYSEEPSRMEPDVAAARARGIRRSG